MAVTLQRRLVRTSLSSVVGNAMSTVRAVRTRETARKEAAFQQAVAAGMGYEAQLKYRNKQLEEEAASFFGDPDFVDTLKSSIANIGKLARFERIRSKYRDSLDEYNTGKGSIANYISVLQSSLQGEESEEMQTEIRGLLSEARTEQFRIETDAIKNRAKLANGDHSKSLIESSISEVEASKTLAEVNGNDDAAAAWDETLLALRSSKARITLEDGLMNYKYQTTKNAMKADQKLGLFSQYVDSAEAATPVTYEGITYPSVKTYWEGRRNEYVANEYLPEVQAELAAETMRIAQKSPFGQIPITRIQGVNDYYNQLKNKPGLQAYADKIELQRADDVYKMATDVQTALADETGNLLAAGRITNEQANERQFKAYAQIEQKFGIQLVRPPSLGEADANKSIASEIDSGVKTKPAIKAPPPPNADAGTLAAYVKEYGITDLKAQPWWSNNDNRFAAWDIVTGKVMPPSTAPATPAKPPDNPFDVDTRAPAKPAVQPTTTNTKAPLRNDAVAASNMAKKEALKNQQPVVQPVVSTPPVLTDQQIKARATVDDLRRKGITPAKSLIISAGY